MNVCEYTSSYCCTACICNLAFDASSIINTFEIPVSSGAVYYLVRNPKLQRHAANKYCSDKYGGHLAHIETYGDLKYVNDVLTAAVTDWTFLFTEIWINGKTNATDLYLFDKHSLTDAGIG